MNALLQLKQSVRPGRSAPTGAQRPHPTPRHPGRGPLCPDGSTGAPAAQGGANGHPVVAVCSRCWSRWRAFGVTRAGGVLPLGTSWRLLLNADPPAAAFGVACPRCHLDRAVDPTVLRHLVVLEGRRRVEL